MNYRSGVTLGAGIAAGMVLVPIFGGRSLTEAVAIGGLLLTPLVVLGLGLETVRYSLETRLGHDTELERESNVIIILIGATAAFSSGALLAESVALVAIGFVLWGFVASLGVLLRL